MHKSAHLLHITGMRSYLGVFPVIIFHIFPEYLPGGFLGVDIFFVISGFLITKILLEKKFYQLFEFYENRARRIIPLLILVLILSYIVAFILILPSELRYFSRNLAAASLFISNWVYFFTTGYMAPALDFDPLVHTWSLGIEFFFYFTFPILILIFKKNKLKIFFFLMLIIFTTSFATYFYYYNLNDSAIFFGYQGRYWEFIIGSFSYFLKKKFKFKNTRNVIFDLLIFIFIIVIFFNFLYANKSGNLAIYSLAVCFFSMLIIILGDNVKFIHHIISSTIVCFFGTISFGMYLWHKPILAFSLHYFDKTKFSILDMIVIFFLIITFSIASYNLYETTFRNKKIINSRNFLKFIIVCIFILFLLGILGWKFNGFPQRFSQRVVHLDNQWKDVSELPRLGCSPNSIDLVFSECKRGLVSSDSNPSFVLLGDSAATSLIKALDEIAINKFKYINLSLPGCPIQDFNEKTKKLNKCQKHIKLVKKMSDQNFFKDIPLLVFTLKHRDNLLNEKKNFSTEEIKEFKLHLNYLKILSKKSSKIILLEPTPAWKFDIPKTLAKKIKYLDKNEFYEITQDKKFFMEKLMPVIEEYKKLSAKSSLELFYTSDLFCETFIKSKCVANVKDEVLYMDDNHLSLAGSRLIVKKLEESGFFNYNK